MLKPGIFNKIFIKQLKNLNFKIKKFLIFLAKFQPVKNNITSKIHLFMALEAFLLKQFLDLYMKCALLETKNFKADTNLLSFRKLSLIN